MGLLALKACFVPTGATMAGLSNTQGCSRGTIAPSIIKVSISSWRCPCSMSLQDRVGIPGKTLHTYILIPVNLFIILDWTVATHSEILR